MRLLDQCRDATGAFLARQPSTHLADQRSRDFMATSLGCDGESIDVAAPPVPSTDHRTNYAIGGIGRHQEDRIAFIDEVLHFVERIRNAWRRARI